MAFATDKWKLVNIRETWNYFSQDVPAKAFSDLNADWPAAWGDRTEDYDMSFRSPIAYLDRSNSFTEEDRNTCGADSYATEQNTNEGAAVGPNSWTPSRPPNPPDTTGNDPIDQTGDWTYVKLLENVFEHDPEGNSGMINMTQSIQFFCEYVEYYDTAAGGWIAMSPELVSIVFSGSPGAE